MRLAILSDIHGNLPALEAVIADLKTRKPDLVINLGDCVSGPLWPKETCDLLRQLNWPTVRGNCDRAASSMARDKLGASDLFAAERLSADDLFWLAELRETIEISPSVLACHGTPTSDCTYLTETPVGGQLVPLSAADITQRLGSVRAPLVLFGHSHIPRLIQASSGQLVLNPGSVGLAAYDDQAPDGSLVLAESGSPHARYAVVTQRGSGFDIEQVSISYDWESAAIRALAAERLDWVKALRNGTMR